MWSQSSRSREAGRLQPHSRGTETDFGGLFPCKGQEVPSPRAQRMTELKGSGRMELRGQ